MKKLLFTLLACLIGLSASAARVYFQNTGNWGTIAVHHWIEKGVETKWPGDVLDKNNNYVVINGTTYYYFDTDREKIIFNNNGGGSQTKDLAVVDGAVYSFAKNNNNGGTTDAIGTITQKSDGSYQFTKAGEVVLVEAKLYFPVSTYDVTQAYLHSWSPQITNNGWPGDKLTKELYNGINFWVLTVTDDREITNKTIGGLQLNTGDNSNQVEKTNVAVNPGYYINMITGETGPVESYKEKEMPKYTHTVYFKNSNNWPEV